MKIIKITRVKKELKNLLVDASFNLPEDIVEAVKTARKMERSGNARTILDLILKNSEIARKEKLPLCQDCGNVYIDLNIGPDVCISSDCREDENPVAFQDAGQSSAEKTGIQRKKHDNLHKIVYELNRVVEEVYLNFYLRKSIVSDPLYLRKNTGTNIPAIINIVFSAVKGLGLEVNLKGGGSENCSWLLMLNPSADEKDIIEKVISLVMENVTRACPPVIIGIGLGSTASEVTKLARRAAFRSLKAGNADLRYARLEKKILKAVNNTGIGPQGLGGNTTALACNIEFAPCHMATLPLAVFFGCHSTRRASILIN